MKKEASDLLALVSLTLVLAGVFMWCAILAH